MVGGKRGERLFDTRGLSGFEVLDGRRKASGKGVVGRHPTSGESWLIGGGMFSEVKKLKLGTRGCPGQPGASGLCGAAAAV